LFYFFYGRVRKRAGISDANIVTITSVMPCATTNMTAKKVNREEAQPAQKEY
jgi:pyruvoyl-dependent arginine decarboxylase (PvlArgDC)